MQLSVGRSVAAEEDAAAKEAVGAAQAQARVPVFALVFATTQYEPSRLAARLAAELGPLPWAGCFSARVIADAEILRLGLVVGIVSGEAVNVGIGIGGPVSTGARGAGRQAATRAIERLPALSLDRHRAVIVLPDGAKGDLAEVVRGAAQELGTAVAWAGGGTGDNFQFSHSVQFANGRTLADRAVVIALDADAPWGTGIEHGWRPYGPPVMVTRAEGSKVIELDYQCAFEVYRQTALGQGEAVSLDKFAQFAAMHPLGIPQVFGAHLIRDPLHLDADGSIQCLGEVPEGSLIRLMQGEQGSLIEAAMNAAVEARKNIGTRPVAGAIVFDCYSRLIAMQGNLQPEVAAIRAALDEHPSVIGCLSLGEVGAIRGGPPQYHNKTAVVMTLAA